MMRDYSLSSLISEIKADVRKLINIKIELLKLEVFEKSSIIGSFLIYGLIITNLVFFALLFAFVALGFLIGDWVNSLAGGFGIVSLIYLIIIFIFIVCRKSIFTGLQNALLKELHPSNDFEQSEKKIENEQIVNDDYL